MIEKKKLKAYILGSIEDLISNFLYYDRKEDEDLEMDQIEEAISEGIITVDEIVEKFAFELKKGIEQ